ncbi:MAG TPA: hypothetical protein VHD56_16480 [Tepidisphaeraceae bacterium]|nr:hypothetical protein [Tepidisphaeraceae bacterium]
MKGQLRIANFGLRICFVALVAVGGCITGRQRPAATEPSTAVDAATTQPSYWLDMPANATVSDADFKRLWTACEDVARDYLFKLDRADYRLGVLTTMPLVSSQVFEPWRRDARTVYDAEESSIAAIRRSIRFEFTRNADDTWTVAPKVLVERQAISEKRITSVVLYRGFFTQTRAESRRPTGTVESDEGIILPERYWYILRRDNVFERVVASAVSKKLHRS